MSSTLELAAAWLSLSRAGSSQTDDAWLRRLLAADPELSDAYDACNGDQAGPRFDDFVRLLEQAAIRLGSYPPPAQHSAPGAQP